MPPLKIRLGSLITIPKKDNPGLDAPGLIKRFTVPNPAYAKTLRQGRSAYNIPRTLSLAKETPSSVVMLRGLLDDLKRDPGIQGVDDQTLAIKAALPSPDLESRPYQEEAVAAFAGKRQGTLVAPTGSGKTAMAVRIICALGQNTLILVHTQDLLAQWQAAFKKFCRGYEVGIIQGKTCQIKAVTVAMMQSVQPYMDTVKDLFGCVLVDECHRTPTVTMKAILNRLPARFRYGVTATLNRADEMDFMIQACLGDVIHEIQPKTLYASGAIIKPQVVVVDTGFMSDYGAILDHLVTDKKRNALIIEQVYEEVRQGNCALVLSLRVDHIAELYRLWCERTTIPAVCATGATPKKEREVALWAIDIGAADVLFASKIADEGLDLPRLNRLFLTCPARHHGKLIQQMGRVTRPCQGKTDAKVYDFVDEKIGLLISQYHNRWNEVYSKL